MMKGIPENLQYLLADQTRAFAFLATIMKDGSPQVTPVWFNCDQNYLLINAAAGRTKVYNMRRDQRVAVAIPDPKNPYCYLQVRGKVMEITMEGAREHIETLALKYRGEAHYPLGPGEERIIFKIEPESITTKG